MGTPHSLIAAAGLASKQTPRRVEGCSDPACLAAKTEARESLPRVEQGVTSTGVWMPLQVRRNLSTAHPPEAPLFQLLFYSAFMVTLAYYS
jgi:hypothetical protein